MVIGNFKINLNYNLLNINVSVVCIRGLEIIMKILPIGSIRICNNYFLIKFNVFTI